jgi:hypothetical protein
LQRGSDAIHLFPVLNPAIYRGIYEAIATVSCDVCAHRGRH